MKSELPSTEWLKLSPFAAIYFILHFLVRFIKHGLLNLMPPFAVLLLQVENKLLWFSMGALAFLTITILYATLYYLFFRYKITEDEIHLQRGVVKKEQLNLNFSRIQNVNVTTPFYFSPFNLVNAQLDAAGSKGQEVVLAGIDKANAVQLRSDVFAYSDGVSAFQENQQETLNKQEQIALKLDNKEVAKFGLFSSTIFLIFALAAPFSKQLGGVLKQHLVNPVTSQYQSVIVNEQLSMVLAIISVVVGIVVLMLCVSVISALLRFYNYELHQDGDKIKRVCGLLEREQFSLKRSKMQSIELKQNWMARLLNRYTLNCKQINNSSPGKAQKDKSLVIPVLTKQQANKVFEVCWDKAIDLTQANYNKVSIRYFYKTLSIFVFFPILVVLLFMLNDYNLRFLTAVFSYFVIATSLSYLRYKRFGYYFSDDTVIVRSGLLGVRFRIFNTFKVQQVSSIQTPPMARNQLASIRFMLASGAVTVPYIDEQLVTAQLNHSVLLAEISNKNWM